MDSATVEVSVSTLVFVSTLGGALVGMVLGYMLGEGF